jgi:hypothetical protein
MEPSQFYFIVIPLATLIAVLVAVNVFLAKQNEESDYKKEMKKLRKLLVKGKLDKQTFMRIRNELKVEDLFADESVRLDNMLKEKRVDSDTYVRMKKILEMSFNQRLEKICKKRNFDDSPQPNI